MLECPRSAFVCSILKRLVDGWVFLEPDRTILPAAGRRILVLRRTPGISGFESLHTRVTITATAPA